MITNEDDNDFQDALLRSDYRPSSGTSLAVEREIEREKVSQLLIDNALQNEQVEFEPVIQVQEVPGERWSTEDEVVNVVVADPQKMVNQPLTSPIDRTTVSSTLKKMMGVPTTLALIKGRATASSVGRFSIPTPVNAFGVSIKAKKVKHTPVKSLNFLDSFFNWINAFLK